MKACRLILIAAIFFLAVSAHGQVISTTDTVWVDSVGTRPDNPVRLDIFFVNADTLNGIDLPLTFTSSDITVDSISFEDSRLQSASFTFSAIDPDQKTIHIGAMGLDSASIIRPGSGLLASIYITVPAGAPDHLVEFDTNYIPPTSHLAFVSKTDESYTPQFRKGYVNVSIATDIISGNQPLLPTEFSLAQNSPNPFNPTTDISFAIPRKGQVRLEIYNLLGQRVRTLLDDNLMPGVHTVTFDGRNEDGQNIASGIYFYRLKAVGEIRTRKMVLLK